jgi:hypothetical protein
MHSSKLNTSCRLSNSLTFSLPDNGKSASYQGRLGTSRSMCTFCSQENRIALVLQNDMIRGGDTSTKGRNNTGRRKCFERVDRSAKRGTCCTNQRKPSANRTKTKDKKAYLCACARSISLVSGVSSAPQILATQVLRTNAKICARISQDYTC